MAGTMTRALRQLWARRGRRALVAVAIILVVGLGVTACGDDGDSGRTGGGGDADATQPGGDASAQSYVGLSKRAAIAKAKAEGRDWRITREDDETFPVTFDYVETRINFEIDDGKVTKATFG